jgi:hypothetical protein
MAEMGLQAMSRRPNVLVILTDQLRQPPVRWIGVE